MQETVDRPRVKGWRGRGDKTKQGQKGQVMVMTTNLVDQELELDDSGTALMLTVALHTRTAKAKSQISQRKLDCCQRSSRRNVDKTLQTQRKRSDTTVPNIVCLNNCALITV